MDIDDIRSLVTLLSFLLFVGLMVRVWRPVLAAAHAEAARLPLDGDDPAAAGVDPARDRVPS